MSPGRASLGGRGRADRRGRDARREPRRRARDDRGARPRRGRNVAARRGRRPSRREIWEARRTLGRRRSACSSPTATRTTSRSRATASSRCCAGSRRSPRHATSSVVTVAHLGDGNIHPKLVYDGREPGAYDRVIEASNAILELVLACGGTLSGEHGIGLEKLGAMGQQFTPPRARPAARRARGVRSRGHPQPRQGDPARGRRGAARGVRACLRCAPGNATVNATGRRDARRAAGGRGARAASGCRSTRTDASRSPSCCASRDGGPREARYGPLAGARALARRRAACASAPRPSRTSRATTCAAPGSARSPIAQATLRLAARLAWRRDALLRGGDAFALAEALRALPSAPAAIVVLAARPASRSRTTRPRRRPIAATRDLAAAAAAAGAELEQIDEADWVARCDALPAPRVRLAGRDARRVAAAGSTRPGRTTPGGGSRSSRTRTSRARIAPHAAGAAAVRRRSSRACGRRSRRERPRPRRARRARTSTS